MKLMVVILSTTETTLRLQHENQLVPYGRRLVQIELTPEQQVALALKADGHMNGETTYERYGDMWFEPARRNGGA